FMGDSLEGKRKFIIATREEGPNGYLTRVIHKCISNATVLSAVDGLDARMKINNDVPHVAFLDLDLAKISGEQLVQTILADKSKADMAIVLVSQVPEKELFVDEVAMGRVQFLSRPEQEENVKNCVVRALNFCSRKTATEFSLRFLSEGEVLIREGEKGESVYIVKKGILKASVIRDHEELFLGQVEPGEFVGEMAYINGGPRSANVTASTMCELIEIPMDHLDHLLFQKPAWSRALMKTLSKRVKKANEKASAS
ncbi:MAG: cyclic nucleotide-binding domain-containing protein, partial [Pseudobdellovibrionaceae bacterium]